MDAIGPGASPLPPYLAARLNSELQPGERLLWAAQPLPGLAARPAMTFSLIGGIILVPALLFIGIIVAVLALIAYFTQNLCFGLFLLPFLGILGIIVTLLIATPLWTRSLARHTFYALTDRRAIIWRKGPFAFHVQSFASDQLVDLQRTERPDGTGDLIFQQRLWHDAHGQSHRQAIGFTAIAQVRHVEDLVRAALLATASNGPVPPPVQ